ncbi:MAG: M48 family metalloprotease, partial [Saccharospirillum sp.]
MYSRQDQNRCYPTFSEQRLPLHRLPRFRQYIAWLCLCLILGSAIPAHAEFGDSSLGWTLEQERAVAGYLQRRLQRQGNVINDVWLEYWLAERAERLRQTSTSTLGPLSVVLLRQKAFNAFALPGNVMGFNLGLWENARTEDEFTSVVAHEIAHLSLRHFNRLSDSNRQQAWLAISGALLGIALASVNSEIGGATLIGSQMGAAQQSLAFSRSMESEADRYATDMLREAGYNPNAGAAVFARLQQSLGGRSGSDYWQTHPRSITRAAQLEAQQGSASGVTGHTDNQYETLRWYINEHYAADDDFAPDPTWQSLTPTSDQLLPQPLMDDPDPNTLFGWTRFQAEPDDPRTLERLALLLTLFPDFDPAWHLRAELTARSDTALACREALSFLDRIKGQYLEVVELRHRLSGDCLQNREAEATAAWYWHRGEETRALTLLRRALELPDNASQLARLREKLSEYER